MPLGEILGDDYVASLLKHDAEADGKRYLTSGLGSLLNRKPRSVNAPKPNTRFLKNIIRETDSHNAALKAKEEEEAKVRLKDLRREQRLGIGRRDDDDDEGTPMKKRGNRERACRWTDALSGLGQRDKSDVHGKRRREDIEDTDGLSGSTQHRSRKHTKRTSEDEKPFRAGTRRRRSVSRTPSPDHRPKHRHRRRSSNIPDTASHRRQDRLSPSRTDHNSARPQSRTNEAHDSDPLEDVLGPAPPSKTLPRGRGAYRSSAIDSRFDASYDPKMDVSLDIDEQDDWDMALEALRDRAHWRQCGVERLRAAGFTDEELRKWENGIGVDGAERDVEAVSWRKKGEGREWDRGKVVDEDGDVELRAEWGRLKDT